MNSNARLDWPALDLPLPLPVSRDAIAQTRHKRLPIVIEEAQRAPFHRQRLSGIDTSRLDDPNEWRKIPILEKEDLRALTPTQFMRDYNIAPRSAIMEYWRSGGSTGQPLFYPRTFEDMRYMYQGFTRGIECMGLKAGDTAHLSFPLGIHPVGHMYARVCQHIGIGVNWAGSGTSTPSAVQVQLIQSLAPTVWMGMSSYALHLANHAEAAGIDLAAGSVERIVCSAEPLSAAKRAKIEHSWGAKVYDSFGMTECCLMGCEDGATDGFRIWDDMFYTEVLDPDSLEPVDEGETGLLVTTPLWSNNATPFIRWNSGDLVSYQSSVADGKAFSVFSIIKHAQRTTGFFKVRGVNINHTEFEDFIFCEEQIRDFKAEIVTVHGLDRLRLSLEFRDGADRTTLKDKIERLTKQTFEVTPEVVSLKSGTLATEFEGAVKAPRFQDNRA